MFYSLAPPSQHTCIMATTKKNYKPKNLEADLQGLDSFQTTPDLAKVALEQYDTPPSIAAHLLFSIQWAYGDIIGKSVVDLGCGCGVLAIGCLLLGASRVVGIDIDREALEIARLNASEMELPADTITFMEHDVCNLSSSDIPTSSDVVIMNPPFGTQDNSTGIDRVFLEKGLELADTVYTMHKSTTRKYWVKHAAIELGVEVEPIMEIKFNIDQIFGFHRNDCQNVRVDLIRVHKPGKTATDK